MKTTAAIAATTCCSSTASLSRASVTSLEAGKTWTVLASSMMINPDQDSDKLAKKTCQRTDFLGALKESNSSSQSSAVVSQENSKDQNKTEEAADSPPPTLTATFDDGQSNSLIRSTLADVTHPVSFSNTTLSEPAKSTDRDSLSQLFEEITDAEEARAHAQAQQSNSQQQETK